MGLEGWYQRHFLKFCLLPTSFKMLCLKFQNLSLQWPASGDFSWSSQVNLFFFVTNLLPITYTFFSSLKIHLEKCSLLTSFSRKKSIAIINGSNNLMKCHQFVFLQVVTASMERAYNISIILKSQIQSALHLLRRHKYEANLSLLVK